MLRALGVVTLQTFTLLRRDRIFWPALAAASFIAAAAGVASSWGTEELMKMLYDYGLLGFQLTGSTVAIFWGVKMIGDARQDGSMEVQLAAPVSRGLWLVGKYCGLSACLVMVSAVFIVLWEATLFVLHYRLMGAPQLLVFALMGLGWLVDAALAVFFATLTRPSLAIFATFAAWIAGLTSALIDQAMTPETPPQLRATVSTIARYWDLQQFNLADKALEAHLPAFAPTLDRGLYGLVLIAILVSVSSVISSRRDVLPA